MTAADDGALWLTLEDRGPFTAGLARLDRRAFTVYQTDRGIGGLGVGADGTIWVSQRGYQNDDGLWHVDDGLWQVHLP